MKMWKFLSLHDREKSVQLNTRLCKIGRFCVKTLFSTYAQFIRIEKIIIQTLQAFQATCQDGLSVNGLEQAWAINLT